ncbi:hypothetical protein [Nocardia sp. JMUB6875]|uniref:hypothetical protein n=1 Tax=Nocardia sp. JMUB6875 TaxID=3158170 RepID=UPI0034E85062
MSDEKPQALPADSGLIIGAPQQTPATLQLGGGQALTASGGTVLPATIPVLDEQGRQIAIYTATLTPPPEPTTRIVGGEEATPHEFPWMVDVRR